MLGHPGRHPLAQPTERAVTPRTLKPDALGVTLESMAGLLPGQLLYCLIPACWAMRQ